MADIDLNASNGFNILEGGIMDITYKIVVEAQPDTKIQIDKLANSIKDDYNKYTELNCTVNSTFVSDRGVQGFYMMINTQTLVILEEILKGYETLCNVKFTIY